MSNSFCESHLITVSTEITQYTVHDLFENQLF